MAVVRTSSRAWRVQTTEPAPETTPRSRTANRQWRATAAAADAAVASACAAVAGLAILNKLAETQETQAQTQETQAQTQDTQAETPEKVSAMEAAQQSVLRMSAQRQVESDAACAMASLRPALQADLRAHDAGIRTDFLTM